jgi:hypothetical protein
MTDYESLSGFLIHMNAMRSLSIVLMSGLECFLS